ncbi:MAG: cupin domain-containing protein [Bacteroidales bacterium]|jgi:quercetin dioxygenase-like cupin family protein|nr:cupin domain-containing protein [Bacteroidales bacterium]
MKTRSETFQVGKKLPWEPAGEGVKRQIMGYDGQLMVVKVHFEKGAVGNLHEHYHSQATYVASGKFELTIGKKKKVLVAGDGYYVAPDELHGCVCLEEGVLIDVFSPHRADFLKK